MDAYSLIGLAFIQFIGLIILKLISILKTNPKLILFLGIKHGNDDWELFEQVALHRVIESDLENEDSETGSKESLTY